jgi:hypothetical protein
MKKNKKNTQKLALNKVTIVKLDAQKMHVINGGGNPGQSTLPGCDLTPVTSASGARTK